MAVVFRIHVHVLTYQARSFCWKYLISIGLNYYNFLVKFDGYASLVLSFRAIYCLFRAIKIMKSAL